MKSENQTGVKQRLIKKAAEALNVSVEEILLVTCAPGGDPHFSNKDFRAWQTNQSWFVKFY